MSERPTLSEGIAESMDAPAELLDLLPALLEGTEDLGVRAQDAIAALSCIGLEPTQRVLDLGCGKGAVALAVAERYGARVLGVDGHADFIAHAQATAARRGLDGLTAFEVGDLRDRLPGHRDCDLIMLLALGDVLGDLETTLRRLASCLRPGGHILIDEAHLPAPGPAQAPWDEDLLAAYGTRAELLDQFQAAGFSPVAEQPIDGPDMDEWYQQVIARLVERAERLAGAHPDRRATLRAFATRQAEQLEHLEGPVRGALFVLKHATTG